MEAYVEPHLRWRLLEASDLPELEQLSGQLDEIDHSVLSGIAAEITERGETLVPELTVGGWDDYETLTAYGSAHREDEHGLRVFLLGGVHPSHRNLSIGGQLFRWQVDHAIAWRDEHEPTRDLWLGCYYELGRPGLDKIAKRLGFELERYYFDLVRDLSTPVPQRACPEGIRVAPFDETLSEDVRALHNAAFATVGGSEVGAQEWATRLADPSFRARWSFVALNEAGQVVGYEMSSVEESPDLDRPVGWTERFGVHEDYRGRGIALLLLSEALRAMQADGCAEAGIGIDSRDDTALTRIGKDLGYTTRDAVQLLSRVVPSVSSAK